MGNIDGVDQIADQLFIGGTRSTYVTSELREAGITHVLKLYFDAPHWPDDFTVRELTLDDGVFIEFDILQQGVTFIQEAIKAGHRVLVVCGLGISRSSTFVLAYLLEQGYDLHDAFRSLQTAHPQAWPARELWQSLITHYQAPYSLMEVQKWVKKTDDYAG